MTSRAFIAGCLGTSLTADERAFFRDARPWGFPNQQWPRQVVWLASVAEMADRVRADNWDANLDQVLCQYPPTQPTPTPTPTHTPTSTSTPTATPTHTCTPQATQTPLFLPLILKG